MTKAIKFNSQRPGSAGWVCNVYHLNEDGSKYVQWCQPETLHAMGNDGHFAKYHAFTSMCFLPSYAKNARFMRHDHEDYNLFVIQKDGTNHFDLYEWDKYNSKWLLATEFHPHVSHV